MNGLSSSRNWGLIEILTILLQRNVELLTPGGSALSRISQQNRVIVNSLLSYNKTFGESHNLSVLAGYSFEENAFRVLRADGTGFLSDVERV